MKVTNENQTIETLSQSAMVRVLFEILTIPKKESFNSRAKLRIKKVEIFPLAFVYSEDCQQDNYSLISSAIHEESHKILDNLPTTDPGMYEMVGEFFGKFTVIDNKCSNRVWDLQDIKAYQLTDEEVQLLPVTLRPDSTKEFKV